MHKCRRLLFIGLALMLHCAGQALPANAGSIPHRINLQGLLTDSTGSPRSYDTVKAELNIYDALVYTMTKQWDYVTVVSIGSGWVVVANN